MSRFVRASKYRHVFGQTAKKDYGYENVKMSGSAWDTNMISASGQYISINWNASGGGAFAILPLPSPFASLGFIPYKLPDQLPLARSHSAPVLDTEWSPHNDTTVASGGEDGKVMIWQVSSSEFEGWGQEGWVPKDFDPVLRIDASARKVGQVTWHPTAQNVLASASGEHVVKLWDLAKPEEPRSVCVGHQDSIQSVTFNVTGTLLATTSRDRKIRIFDPRAGGDAVRVGDGHGGIKGARVVWMGEMDRIATTGFSKMSDRQVGIWDTGSLSNMKMLGIDQSAGVVMPFWTDNNILFLAGKGDGNIRYYEYESDNLFALTEHKSSDPQRGMCFLPRRSLNVSECEIARAYKVSANSIEPIAFIVPRKADSFQADIFPPAPSIEPSLSAHEFFSGSKAPERKLVSLDSGATFTSTSLPPPTPASQPLTPSPASPLPPPSATLTSSAPTPSPGAVPSNRGFASMIERDKEPESPVISSRQNSVGAGASAVSGGDDDEIKSLRSENERLTSALNEVSQELRETREKLRNLELALEASRANARKAAEALLNA